MNDNIRGIVVAVSVVAGACWWPAYSNSDDDGASGSGGTSGSAGMGGTSGSGGTSGGAGGAGGSKLGCLPAYLQSEVTITGQVSLTTLHSISGANISSSKEITLTLQSGDNLVAVAEGGISVSSPTTISVWEVKTSGGAEDPTGVLNDMVCKIRNIPSESCNEGSLPYNRSTDYLRDVSYIWKCWGYGVCPSSLVGSVPNDLFSKRATGNFSTKTPGFTGYYIADVPPQCP
ncbi:MAG: hypothetical protein FWD57_11660 [Polyangiaceae bacterium]|nr:hypothetical protein [Polyangiaceae bacterium]